jgi:prepilin-type N-terminal cleavage/methylation domain-containing protein
MSRHRSRSGFTLIELLVTVFVLAIGLGVIFALLTMTADQGREQRDNARVRGFAETVFASLEWYVEGQAPVPGGGPDPLTVPVLDESGLTEAVLDVSGEEALWPPGEGLEPKRIRYRVELVDDGNGIVEATVQAGMAGELNTREFKRIFLEMQEAFP